MIRTKLMVALCAAVAVAVPTMNSIAKGSDDVQVKDPPPTDSSELKVHSRRPMGAGEVILGGETAHIVDYLMLCSQVTDEPNKKACRKYILNGSKAKEVGTEGQEVVSLHDPSTTIPILVQKFQVRNVIPSDQTQQAGTEANTTFREQRKNVVRKLVVHNMCAQQAVNQALSQLEQELQTTTGRPHLLFVDFTRVLAVDGCHKALTQAAVKHLCHGCSVQLQQTCADLIGTVSSDPLIVPATLGCKLRTGDLYGTGNGSANQQSSEVNTDNQEQQPKPPKAPNNNETDAPTSPVQVDTNIQNVTQ